MVETQAVVITTSMLIAIISAIVLVVALLNKKSGTRKTLGWIGGIGLALMVLAMVMSTSLPASVQFLNNPLFGKTVDFGGTSVTLSTVDSASPVIEGKCIGIEDTTVTLSSKDKYSSASTGGTHRYATDGNPALTVSNAGTFTASPGDVIKVLWENGTLSGTYFSLAKEYIVPCSGTVTFSEDLVRNGTATIDVFNEEGNLMTADTVNESLSAGDVVTLSSKLKGQYQRGFPYGGVIVAEYNKTTIDDVIVDFGGSKVSTPQAYAITYGADSSTKTFSVPAILSNQIIQGSVVIDADDTNNPTAGSDVILTFYPSNYFINEDTGGSFDGPSIEDEKNARTYGHATAQTLGIE